MRNLFRILARHRAITSVVAVLFAAAVVVAGALYLESRQSRLTVGPGAAEEASPPDSAEPKPSSFVWPTFGYVPQRSHNLASRIKPPFRQLWRVRPTGELLEFPPSYAKGRLHFVDYDGRAFALSARTGKFVWKRKLGALAAATPAYSDGRLYTTVLCVSACSAAIGSSRSEGRGRVAALDARTGRVIWSRDLPSRTESTPLVLGGKVIFGSEDGTVYALRTANGRVAWRHRATDAVKSGLAYENGRLYFGDYAGAVTALRARDGKLVWTRSNVSPENFYGTPAVGFGRVFLSTTDGKVHALRLNGNVDWRFSAGPSGYIYASPALGKPPGLGPTVFIGAHTSRFYAIDARTGRERWSKGTPGPISGTATVIGDYVYFSSLHGRMTYAVRARDGKEAFRRRQGAFDPAIADERRVYLIGYSTVTALEPVSERSSGRRVGRADARERRER